MKHLVVILTLIFPLSLCSQTPAFKIKNFDIERDIYNREQGTTGLLLHFDYYYSNSKVKLVATIPSLSILQENLEVYKHPRSIVPIKANNWYRMALFIPYRNINLLKGKQQEVTLNFELAGLAKQSLNFVYNQPLRYNIEIKLKGGVVKRKLKQYDQGTDPREWLPDSYFILTTSDSLQPIYRSKVNPNSYKLQAETIRLHLLAGEILQWRFYDKNNQSADQLLGVYQGFKADGDFSDKILGIMFGDIANLAFDYSQKEQAIQAISIYSDGLATYQGIKGVAVRVQYDLAKAYEGVEALAKFKFYDKNNNAIDLPYCIPLNDQTPRLQEYHQLKRKNELKYFIPFYAWETTTQKISFDFEIKDKTVLKSAYHIIRKPITFGNFVQKKEFKVLEDYEYQGVNGVLISMDYQVNDIHQIGDLEVNLTALTGTKMPSAIFFSLESQKGKTTTVKRFPFRIPNPKESDIVYLFIPYQYIFDAKFKATLDIHHQYSPIALIDENTPLLKHKTSDSDASLVLEKAGDGFLMDNYGQVLDFNINIPKLFNNNSQLVFEVKRNGQVFDNYIISGDINQKLLHSNTASFSIGIPHRLLNSRNKINIITYLADLEGTPMSKTISWDWEAPQELWNQNIIVSLQHIVFEKSVAKDTTNGAKFAWKFIVKVGNKSQIELDIPPHFKAKDKKAFKKNLFINREDNIEIYIYNSQSKEQIRIWKGDWSKLAQNGYKASISRQKSIKSAKISVEQN